MIFDISGVHGISTGFALLSLIYLSATSETEFFTEVLRLFTMFQLGHGILMQIVMRITGNGTHTVAPNAPGNWTPLVHTVLHGLALYLL